MKYQSNDICLVFKGHHAYTEGAVVQIVDRNTPEKQYLVSTLEEIGKFDGDFGRIMDTTHWVEEADLRQLKFTPSFWERILIKLSKLNKKIRKSLGIKDEV